MVKKQKLKEKNAVKQCNAQGSLIVIGGHEDKEGEQTILKECAKRIGNGKLVIASVASHSNAGELWEEYRKLFQGLGIKEIVHLNIERREQSLNPEQIKLIEGATAFFFTGGDQLKITSELGGTMLADKIHEIYRQGGVIAGTSAGASVLSETMFISGHSDARKTSSLKLGAGLGFIRDIIIDQHFAARGRIGRLLGAVAQNPKLLGVGIDENTAIIVEGENHFKVVGMGAVYVLDGREMTDSNICDAKVDVCLSISDVRLHLLSENDTFDLVTRRPTLCLDDVCPYPEHQS